MVLHAKINSKGKITIPVEIQNLLYLNAGDWVTFNSNNHGVMMGKHNKPKSIQERFADYNYTQSNKDLTEQMTEIDTGIAVGREILE